MLKTVSTQLALASDTLPEVLAKGNTTGGTDLAVSSGDDITFADNSKVILGDGSDLSIYSDGATGQVSGNVVITGTSIFNGNVGVDATPEAWLSVYKGIDIGLGSAIIGRTDNSSTNIMTNLYRDSAGNFIHKNTGVASLTSQESGYYYWSSAPSAAAGSIATLTNDMILYPSGQLSVPAGVLLGGTAAANLLDDYEEGTFSITSDSGEVVIAANTGYYTKVGRVVTCTGAVSVASIGTPVGNVGFDGLPFATANATNIGAGISLYTYGWKTSMTTHVMASLSGNSSSWFVQKSNGAGSVAVLSGDVQATTYIQYTIVYQTA
jgi:hypothetical protein